MARPLAAWLGIIALGAAFGWLGWRAGQQALLPPEQPVPEGLVVVEEGGVVPDLRLPDLVSGELRAVRPQGRPRLVNFWASWCGPCRREMPALSAYAVEQGRNGVEVLGIALDEPAAARAFLTRLPVAFPNLVDSAGRGDSSVVLGNRRGALPYSVLIAADGRLLGRHYGAFDDAGEVAGWVQGQQ